MKLLQVNGARSIWLGTMGELNPRGLHLRPLMIPGLIERYKFQEYPSWEEQGDQQKGEVFKRGVFEVRKGVHITVDLTIYSDGIVADTGSSTSDTDAFLKDGFNWLVNTFRLPRIEEVIKRKLYVSEVYVETEKHLNFLNPHFESFSKLLSSKVRGYGPQVSMETVGISFGVDEGLGRRPINFRFERAASHDFSQNQYYSVGPFETDAHLEILEELEKILAS